MPPCWASSSWLVAVIVDGDQGVCEPAHVADTVLLLLSSSEGAALAALAKVVVDGDGWHWLEDFIG